MMMAAMLPAYAQGQSGEKALVVYFSLSGNTVAVANHIKDATGADMFRLETVTPYPDEHNATTELARTQKESNARPQLKGRIDNIAQYDTIFIGFPIWWSTYPMGVATFLDTYDLEGKTIIPFCTHEGSRQGQSFNDMRRAEPNATYLEGIAIRGGQAANSRQDVEAWLRRIGVIR